MKQLYTLIFATLISTYAFGQSIFINEIHYDNASTDAAEGVEIAGPAGTDVTGYQIIPYNGNGGVPYTPIGTFSGTIPDQQNGYGTLWVAISGLQNGAPDGLALVDNNGTVIQFLSYEGSFTATDGPANGMTSTNISVVEDGTNASGTSLQLQGSGSVYSDFTWTSTPITATAGAINTSQTFVASACNVTLGTVNIVCGSSTLGDNNDGVTIEISYIGSNASITSVSTTSSGTIGGDNPATTPDGTITLSGLSEGSAWDIFLNGGDCDGSTLSGTVAADHCDPLPNVCFDLSAGTELFELVSVDTNTQGDVWNLNSGVYSINGYCSGCADMTVDGWLVFGPLDMTGVTDLSLAFDATKTYTETPLVIAYASSYPGCPSDATWNSLQTLTASGSYEVDLSAVTGASVFIGIQYIDDGADGFSGWALSNVALQAFNNCPILGTRPTSDCLGCDLVLDPATTNCDTTTSGIDTYTVEISFTGGGAANYTVGSTTGTVGGDDPSSVTSGTISITGVSEGTDVTVTVNGDGSTSNCSFNVDVTSPVCISTSCPTVGAIIFTEIMQNPGIVADTAGEWFEVYNTTTTDIDMIGWTVMDDATTTESDVISTSVIVPAGGYALFGNNGDTATNGGITLDYVYSSGISLGNTTDGLQLLCGGNVIDVVIWDDGATFPDPSGASMELSTSKFDATSNDDGANWGTALTTYGSGDKGTPGVENDFTLGIGYNTIPGFSLYPNPVSNQLVIHTEAGLTKNVQIFDLLGKQVLAKTIQGNTLDVTIPSGIYLIKVEEAGKVTSQKLVVK